MKRIFAVLTAFIMLMVVSSIAMARPIAFMDSRDQFSISREISGDDDDEWAVGFGIVSNGNFAFEYSKINSDSNIGLYYAVSQYFELGFSWGENDTNSTDFRARIPVDDNLTLAAKLDWIDFRDDSSALSDEKSLMAQLEYSAGERLLFNVGGLTIDNDVSSNHTRNNYLVAGVEIRFLENETGAIKFFVDGRVPIDNRDEDDKISIGISLF